MCHASSAVQHPEWQHLRKVVEHQRLHQQQETSLTHAQQAQSFA
jgi:hypothetical protein